MSAKQSTAVRAFLPHLPAFSWRRHIPQNPGQNPLSFYNQLPNPTGSELGVLPGIHRPQAASSTLSLGIPQTDHQHLVMLLVTPMPGAFLYLSKSRHTEIKWTPYKIPAMKWLCGYTKLISLSKCCEATSKTIPSFNSQVGEVFPIFRNLGLLRTVRYNNSELTLIFLNYARL